MKKLYCVICGKYRKVSYLLEKALVLSIISLYLKKKNQLKY